LLDIKAYETWDEKLQKNIVKRYVKEVEPQKGWIVLKSNPEIPSAVHQTLQRWYDVLDGKPHVNGPMYYEMDMNNVRTNEDFQNYQTELYNNMPLWHKELCTSNDDLEIIMDNPLNTIVYRLEIY